MTAPFPVAARLRARRAAIQPALALVWALACVPGAAAQGRPIERSPARPRLAAEADTNDANAYFALGVDYIARATRQPAAARAAAAAFYWAARLDPRSADAVYARSVALLLEDSVRMRVWWEDTTSRAAPDIRYLDSLSLQSARLDPLARENLEALVITRYAEILIGPELRRRSFAGSETDVAPADLRNAIHRNLRYYGHELGARYYYCEGRFDSALVIWAQAAQLQPRNARIHASRARAFYHAGQLDSARASLERALRMARAADADSMRFVYESKAAWEHALGRIAEQQHDLAAARSAYERALTEDLTWYPAHHDLARLYLSEGDTAAALRELARAAGTADDAYLAQWNYGFRLATRGQLDSAVAHLRRATEIEPLAFEAYLLLGLAADARHDTAGARDAYRSFVSLAPRGHPRLGSARERLAALGP